MESITEYTKRAQRYSNIEGSGELSIGVLLLGLALFHYLDALVPENSIWSSRYTHLIGSLVLLLLVSWGLRVLKEKVTYRRTGYAKQRRVAWTAVMAGILGCGVGLIVLYALNLFVGQTAIALCAGITMAVLYAFGTRLDRPWRWIAALAMAVVPFAVYTTLPVRHADKLSVAILGACWLVSGIATFCAYLRETEPVGSSE